MPTKSNELNNCTYVKGLLVISIVLYHSMLIFASSTWFRVPSQPSAVFDILARFLNSFHIYTFTFISGYIYSFICFEEGRYNNNVKFWKNKFKRLVVPYIFMTLLWGLPVYYHFFTTDIWNIMEKFFLADSPEQLWFLLMIFWVFVIYHFISRWIDKHFMICTLLIAALYLIGTIWDYTLDYFQFFKGLQFILFFHVGVCWRKFSGGDCRIYKIPSALLATVHVFLFALQIYVSGLHHDMIIKLLDLGLTSFLHIYGAFAWFVIFQKAVYKKYIRECSIVRYVSKYGMSIYLIHQQIIYFVLNIVMNKLSPCLLVLITFTLTLCISSIIAWCLESNKLTKILVGGK